MHRCLRTLPLFLLLLLVLPGLMAQSPVNSPGPDTPREIDPLLRPDGQELLFTRTNYAKNKGADNAADIWMMTRYADGSWGRALNPGSPINSFAHDRALAFSPDGSRLTVLRTGTASFVELLESSGRNWRILDTWPLPEGVAPRYDLTFDPNTQQLIYSAYDGGNLDLYRRQALPDGTWGEATPLNALNSSGNEMSPTLAADGRTLYFRRNGSKWFRQDITGKRPVLVSLPTEVNQFSTSLVADEIIATLPGNSTRKDYLAVLPVAPADLPLPVNLIRGYLPEPPSPGEQTSRVALENGTVLTVRPDALNRYSLFLRAGETLAIAESMPAPDGSTLPLGSLATTGPSGATSMVADRQRLEDGIARRQRELDQLDAERRKYDLVAPKREDPELMALRDRLNRTSSAEFRQDTLPPSTASKESGRNNRYAKELSELERMKAKFRKQQNERLGDRNRSGHQWTEKSTPTTPAPTTANRSIPSIGEVYRPMTIPVRSPEEQARLYNDSLRMAAEIRTGLQKDNSPRIYERASWENEVRQGLPQQQPLTPDEIARLDADYQQQLAELEALRAELRRLEATPSTAPTYRQEVMTNPAARSWTAKGEPTPRLTSPGSTTPSYDQPYARPAEPTQYGTPAPTEVATGAYGKSPSTPSSGRGAPMPAGISFIPNTAYPDGRGYTGLDQLFGLIRQSSSTLEIRVHTPVDLPPRVAQLLSEERATTIRNFLIDKGVLNTMYKVVGYGNHLTGEQGERVEVLR